MYGIISRKKIMAIKGAEKLSIRETAKRFGITATTIQKWNKRIEQKIGRKQFTRKLKEDIKKNPDLYQFERARKFGVSQNSIHKALKRIGVTYKKNIKAPESRRREAYIV